MRMMAAAKRFRTRGGGSVGRQRARSCESCERKRARVSSIARRSFEGSRPPASKFRVSHLGVVLHVSRVERDGFQIQLAVQVNRRHDVPAGAREGASVLVLPRAREGSGSEKHEGNTRGAWWARAERARTVAAARCQTGARLNPRCHPSRALARPRWTCPRPRAGRARAPPRSLSRPAF